MGKERRKKKNPFILPSVWCTLSKGASVKLRKRCKQENRDASRKQFAGIEKEGGRVSKRRKGRSHSKSLTKGEHAKKAGAYGRGKEGAGEKNEEFKGSILPQDY